MKKVYCLIGRKRVGKDTAADYISEKLYCPKYALATPLKELVCNLFSIEMEELDRYKNEEWDLVAANSNGRQNLQTSFRSILQRCGDSQKNFFGLDCYMHKLHEKMLGDNVVVVSDVRLEEEQKWLTVNTDPIFIKIVRDVEQDVDSTHRTETEADSLGYDVLIENNGTIEELYEKLDKVIERK